MLRLSTLSPHLTCLKAFNLLPLYIKKSNYRFDYDFMKFTVGRHIILVLTVRKDHFFPGCRNSPYMTSAKAPIIALYFEAS